MQINDVVWYKTGIYSASKVKIVDIRGSGAAKIFVVNFIDHAPDQTDGSKENKSRYPTGGIGVSPKSCVAL